jgi:hypothetical protein
VSAFAHRGHIRLAAAAAEAVALLPEVDYLVTERMGPGPMLALCATPRLAYMASLVSKLATVRGCAS